LSYAPAVGENRRETTNQNYSIQSVRRRRWQAIERLSVWNFVGLQISSPHAERRSACLISLRSAFAPCFFHDRCSGLASVAQQRLAL